MSLGYRNRDTTRTASSQLSGDKAGRESPICIRPILGPKPILHSQGHLLLVFFFFLDIRSHVAQAGFEPM